LLLAILPHRVVLEQALFLSAFLALLTGHTAVDGKVLARTVGEGRLGSTMIRDQEHHQDP
jgi:hypothetical protein